LDVSKVDAKLLIMMFWVELFKVADLKEVPRTLGLVALYNVTITSTPAGIATVDETTPSKIITRCGNGIPTILDEKFARLVPGDI
jgi:hypothetical protein